MELNLTKTAIAWRLDVDDQSYELNAGEITPRQASALRLSSHGAWRVPTLLAAVWEGVGPEEVCGLVFLARRQAGEDVTYDAVVDQIDKSSSVRLDFGDAPAVGEVVADPES